MKKAQLSGSLRANVGKKDSSALRNADRVPCVLYGSGKQIHFHVKQIDIQKIIFSPDVYQVEIEVDGNKSMGIIQEIQQHPVTDKIVHVDFLELVAGKQIKVGLPVRLEGTALGVINGGRLLQVFRRLSCLGLPKDLPEAISIDVSKLRIGNSIRISSIQIPGVTILDPANAVVVSVKMARNAIEEEEEEEEEEEGAEGAEGAEAKEGAEAPASEEKAEG